MLVNPVAEKNMAAARTVYFFFVAVVIVVVAAACVGSPLADFVVTERGERTLIVGIEDMIGMNGSYMYVLYENDTRSIDISSLVVINTGSSGGYLCFLSVVVSF